MKRSDWELLRDTVLMLMALWALLILTIYISAAPAPLPKRDTVSRDSLEGEYLMIDPYGDTSYYTLLDNGMFRHTGAGFSEGLMVKTWYIEKESTDQGYMPVIELRWSQPGHFVTLHLIQTGKGVWSRKAKYPGDRNCWELKRIGNYVPR